MFTVDKIISGGQTGVDRAALDFTLKNNINCGGWCPKTRLTEDGKISAIYPLTETPLEEYPQRTEWNVRDSDGTLIIARGELNGGTLRTKQLAEKLKKPCLVIDPKKTESIKTTQDWLKQYKIQTLNIAGPRASKDNLIYQHAISLLSALFD